MKEQEPQPPGFIEGLGIKSALWFEGKLDEWSKPPTIQLSSHKRSKKGLVTLAGLGTLALMLGLAYYRESGTGKILPQPLVPRTGLPIPRPIEAKIGEVEIFLPSRQTVATFRGGMVLNYVEGVQMSMFPSVLERLSLDPRVGINLPFDKQGFAFVLPIKEIEKPVFKRMTEEENDKRFLLAEYDRQQNLRAQGIKSVRTHNVAIPLYEILERVYNHFVKTPYSQYGDVDEVDFKLPLLMDSEALESLKKKTPGFQPGEAYKNQPNQDMPIGCFYRLVELELAFSWAEGMRMVAIDQPDLPILRRTLSNDAINSIGNLRPQPFRVYSIEPNLIEEALGLSYGTLKTGGACG